MTNIDSIIKRHNQLEKQLILALSTMERSDKIFEIKKEIIENQKKCPHVDNQYNWAVIDGICPYCGFTLNNGR